MGGATGVDMEVAVGGAVGGAMGEAVDGAVWGDCGRWRVQARGVLPWNGVGGCAAGGGLRLDVVKTVMVERPIERHVA